MQQPDINSSPGRKLYPRDKVSPNGSADISTPANDRDAGPPGFAGGTSFFLLPIQSSLIREYCEHIQAFISRQHVDCSITAVIHSCRLMYCIRWSEGLNASQIGLHRFLTWELSPAGLLLSQYLSCKEQLSGTSAVSGC